MELKIKRRRQLTFKVEFNVRQVGFDRAHHRELSPQLRSGDLPDLTGPVRRALPSVRQFEWISQLNIKVELSYNVTSDSVWRVPSSFGHCSACWGAADLNLTHCKAYICDLILNIAQNIVSKFKSKHMLSHIRNFNFTIYILKQNF